MSALWLSWSATSTLPGLSDASVGGEWWSELVGRESMGYNPADKWV